MVDNQVCGGFSLPNPQRTFHSVPVLGNTRGLHTLCAAKQHTTQRSAWHWLALRLTMPAVERRFFFFNATLSFLRNKFFLLCYCSSKLHFIAYHWLSLADEAKCISHTVFCFFLRNSLDCYLIHCMELKIPLQWEAKRLLDHKNLSLVSWYWLWYWIVALLTPVRSKSSNVPVHWEKPASVSFM